MEKIELNEKFLIMKNSDVFNVELLLKYFGDFFRVMLIDSTTEEILISKIFEDKEEALSFFYEIQAKLKEIKDYILDNKEDKAGALSKKLMDFSKSLEDEIISPHELSLEDEEEKDLKENASFLGSLSKKGYFFDMYKKDKNVIGILFKGKNVVELKKINSIKFNDIEDAQIFFENLK